MSVTRNIYMATNEKHETTSFGEEHCEPESLGLSLRAAGHFNIATRRHRYFFHLLVPLCAGTLHGHLPLSCCASEQVSQEFHSLDLLCGVEAEARNGKTHSLGASGRAGRTSTPRRPRSANK